MKFYALLCVAFVSFAMISCDGKEKASATVISESPDAVNGTKARNGANAASPYDILMEKYDNGTISSSDYPKLIEMYSELLEYFEKGYSAEQLANVGQNPNVAADVFGKDYEKYRNMNKCCNALYGIDLGEFQKQYEKIAQHRRDIGL